VSGKPGISVAAGVLLDRDGRALIAQRPGGAHQEGWWEFPGGKIRADETPLQGLVRELSEEIGIEVRSADELLTYDHEYPDRIVRLHVWRVTDYAGRPSGMENQPLRWVAIGDLMVEDLLPADEPIVAALQQMVSSNSTS
jgi:8-oxo-dGTP diphosphatase